MRLAGWLADPPPSLCASAFAGPASAERPALRPRENLGLPKLITFTREKLVAILKEWRREWDETPHQFLINEAFRQSDPDSYAEQTADHLLAKLIADEKGGAA